MLDESLQFIPNILNNTFFYIKLTLYVRSFNSYEIAIILSIILSRAHIIYTRAYCQVS